MKTHIITIFDKHHLGRAVTCRKSLLEQAPDSLVYFLCLDKESYEMSKKLNLKDTVLLTPEELKDPELLEVRKSRTNAEFASTAKPAFLLYMIKNVVEPNDLVMFVDPDFYFYSPTDSLFQDVSERGSITITPHRFPPHREDEKYKKGIYNAGMVFFKNNDEAKVCLEEWRKQCLEWCYLRYEDGKIGDQGYLSEWPKKYKNVYELAHKGVNLSNWNIENYGVVKTSKNTFLIDDEPLVCYHFHGLKFYINNAGKVSAYPITIYHKDIYNICLKSLDETYKDIQKFDSAWQFGTVPKISWVRNLKQKISMGLR